MAFYWPIEYCQLNFWHSEENNSENMIIMGIYIQEVLSTSKWNNCILLITERGLFSVSKADVMQEKQVQNH